MKANINYLDDKGEPRVILTSLFDFFDIPAREMTTRPTLRFGLPRKMIPFLECSGRWGRIKAEITCAMTSRYAIALYELCSFGLVWRSHWKPSPLTASATYSVCRREIRSRRQPDAQGDRARCSAGERPVRHGRDDPGNRKHSSAPVDSFNVAWWRKSPDDFRSAQQERNRSKVGRMARLKGAVETVAPRAVLHCPASTVLDSRLGRATTYICGVALALRSRT